MTSPLPPGWTAHNDSAGRTYYAHIASGTSQWDVPIAGKPPPPPPPPPPPLPPPTEMHAYSQGAHGNARNNIPQPIHQQQPNVQVVYVPVNPDGTISNVSSHGYSVNNVQPFPVIATPTGTPATPDTHTSPPPHALPSTPPQQAVEFYTPFASPMMINEKGAKDLEDLHASNFPPMHTPSQMYTQGPNQTNPSFPQVYNREMTQENPSSSQEHKYGQTNIQSSPSPKMVFNPFSPQSFRKHSPQHFNTLPKSIVTEAETTKVSNNNQPLEVASPSGSFADDVPYLLQHLKLSDSEKDKHNTASSPTSIEPQQNMPQQNNHSHLHKQMSAPQQSFESLPPPRPNTHSMFHSLPPQAARLSSASNSRPQPALSAPVTPRYHRLSSTSDMELPSQSSDVTRPTNVISPLNDPTNDYIFNSPIELRFTKTRTLDARVCFAQSGDLLFKIGRVGIEGGLSATNVHNDDDVIKASFDNNGNLLYELLQVKRFTMNKRRSGRMFIRSPASGTIIATLRKRTMFGGPVLVWPGEDDIKASPFLEIKRISFLSRISEYIITEIPNQRVGVAATVTCVRGDGGIRSGKTMPHRATKVESGINIALLCMLIIAADENYSDEGRH